MAYSSPTFNLPVNIWRNGNPTSNPPDVVTVGNLALGRRSGILLANSQGGTADQGGMWLLLPAGTDVRDDKAASGRDTVEVGAGTGRYYQVVWVDDAGGGFTNEHRFAELIGVGPWATPFATPSLAPIPPAGLNLFSDAFDSAVATQYTSPDFIWTQPSVSIVLLYLSTGTVFPAMSDSLGNPIGFIQSSLVGLSYLGTVAQMTIYRYTPVISPDHCVVDIGAGDAILIDAYEMPRVTLDRHNALAGTVAPCQVPLLLPTTSAIETGIACFAYTGITSIPGFWQPPFTIFPGTGQLTGALHNGWGMASNIALLAGMGGYTAEFQPGAFTFANWYGNFATFK